MSSDATSLTAQDHDSLRRPLLGFLCVAGGQSPPQPRPVWFEATAEGTIQLFTGPDTLKVRRLRRDPRASITVAAPVGERDLDDPADELAGMLADESVRIVIHPETVRRFIN